MLMIKSVRLELILISIKIIKISYLIMMSPEEVEE